MIQDFKTNKVYIAEGLAGCRGVFDNLVTALSQEQIQVEALPRTKSIKHIWARDYMPIQLDKDKFLFYKYFPDYLKDDKEYIPDCEGIFGDLHLSNDNAEIILDGGNLVKCGDKVIMTDKIFKENVRMEKNELIAKLEDSMKAQIVIIPWDRYEDYGHSDGMVQWIEGERVLLNNYGQIDRRLRKRLLNALSPHFVVEELEYETSKLNELSWAYLNFLRINNCIFVPGLHAEEDSQALEQIGHFYPDCKVIQIQGCEELAGDGGALHCVTWNVLVDSDKTAIFVPA